MKIKVSKIILESAQLFKAKGGYREYLCGILFCADGRVMATNGHTAFIGEGHEGDLKEDVIIDISKLSSRKYKHAEVCAESGVVTYFCSLGRRVGVGMASVIEGRFPDVDGALNVKPAPCVEIGFNAQYINKIAQAAKMFDPNNSAIRVTVSGECGVSVMDMKSAEGLKGKVGVMPIRL